MSKHLTKHLTNGRWITLEEYYDSYPDEFSDTWDRPDLFGGWGDRNIARRLLIRVSPETVGNIYREKHEYSCPCGQWEDDNAAAFVNNNYRCPVCNSEPLIALVKEAMANG